MNTLEIIRTVFYISLLWILYNTLVKNYFIDKTREDLYTIRDKFFLFADDNTNDLSFDNYAYGVTRMRINAMIRYTHQTTFWAALMSLLFQKNNEYLQERIEVRANKIEEALKPLSKESAAEVKKVSDEITRVIAKRVLFSSLVGFMLIISLLLIAVCVILIIKISSKATIRGKKYVLSKIGDIITPFDEEKQLEFETESKFNNVSSAIC